MVNYNRINNMELDYNVSKKLVKTNFTEANISISDEFQKYVT